MEKATAGRKREFRFLQIKENRNYGIDLLRIVAMYMVVVLHVLNLGGITNSETVSSGNYWTAAMLRIATYCAVDIYALISGFVGYKAKHRYANLATLWLTVEIYSVSFAVINMLFFNGSMGKKKILFSLFPATQGNLWYFTMYFCLFFFMPLLNAAVERLPRRTLKFAVLSFIALFTIIPLLWRSDPFIADRGYSLLWLIVLYLIGAYIGKYRALERIKKPIALLGYFACIAVVWCSKYAIKSFFPGFLTIRNNDEWFIGYTTFPIFLSAVFLLLLFRDLKLPVILKRITAVVSPLSFSVYVIHSLPLIYVLFIKDKFVSYAAFSPPVMILAVLGTAAAIFLACAAIDFVRARIFDLLKVKERLLKLEKKLRKE